MAVDLKLDASNDIELDENFDLLLVTGVDEVAQHMTTQLKTPRGGDPIETRFGLPFFELILIKAPDLGAITSVIRGTIAGRADVISVPKYEQTFQEAARKLVVEFEAETTEGLAAVFVPVVGA